MATYNEKTEDGLGRQIKPVLFNTAKDGSGTWYFTIVDADGHLQVDTLNLMPTTTTKYAVAMTSADTEYSQALTNVKKFRIHTRDYSAFRLAYVTGKVATPTDPYETIPAGGEKYEDNLNIASLTLYFASAVAGKTAEIEVWS